MPTTDMAAPGASRRPVTTVAPTAWAAATRLLARLSPTAERRPPTGSCLPVRRRAVPAGGEPAGRLPRLRHFPEGLGPHGLRPARVRERSGKGGGRRCPEPRPSPRRQRCGGPRPRPLKGAAGPSRAPSSLTFFFPGRRMPRGASASAAVGANALQSARAGCGMRVCR